MFAPVILERLPEVQKLPAAQKRQLAEELWQSTEDVNEAEVDPAVLALLEARLADHEASPETAASWSEVKARVFGRHAG